MNIEILPSNGRPEAARIRIDLTVKESALLSVALGNWNQHGFVKKVSSMRQILLGVAAEGSE